MADRPLPRVAIACQGGGTHTAFTAGVLRTLMRGGGYRVVALSGTSGGAICALLAWYGFLTGGPDEAARLLEGFWWDIRAGSPLDLIANSWQIFAIRLFGLDELLAYSPFVDRTFMRVQLARRLQQWVDFSRVRELARDNELRLMVGAVDVLAGEHRVFDSARCEVSLEAVLASAAVPNLFRAVRIQDSLYWDGLLSQNPPVRDLHEADPDELWLVQVEPRRRSREPLSPVEILDRRTELAGNLSVDQELYFIQTMNRLVAEGSLPAALYRHIDIRRITLEEDLDVASKGYRAPSFIERLMRHGEAEAEDFLARLAAGEAESEELAPKYRRGHSTGRA